MSIEPPRGSMPGGSGGTGGSGGSGSGGGTGRSRDGGSTAVSVFRFRRGSGGPPAGRFGGRSAAGDEPRHGGSGDPLRATLVTPRSDPQRNWDALNPIRLDDALIARNRLIVAPGTDAASAAFDMLRTQLAQAAIDNGWRRIAVTSPTPHCGKSYVLANLALALARRPDYRTVVVDLDLRAPSLADLFGVHDAGRLADVLTGEQPVESMFHRLGMSLALGLNDRAEPASAEILQDPRSIGTLDAVEASLAPDLMLFDLPPLIGRDDVLAFLPRVDGVLLVADGQRTLARDMTEAERLLKGRTTLVGVVLNRADTTAAGL